MELKTPSESEAISLPDCASDAEEQEFSDDDRNHKHRKRDTRSQSLERDQTEQFMSRSYRKHGKPFDPSRETDSQSRYNTDREFPSRFGRRPINPNQRFKTNQPFSGEFGSGRGRGRNSGFWNQRDSRFPPIDIASQMGPPHPSAVFPGSSPWPAGGFGLIPNDPLHPLGPFGPPSLNMGIPRQRCRDFEERGFCLRGDMCLMEHGVNRIVVEDVQSLSQFNLPASLPGGHVLGNPGGIGLPGPTVNASSSSVLNSKVPSSRAIRPDIDDVSIAADVYDPDQPLWNTSTAVQTSTELSYMEPTDPSLNGPSSIWGRMNNNSGGTRNKEKSDPEGLTSHHGKRKPFQKALRTLFVSNIPAKDNKKEPLHSHFKKFGEVIDIHIPANSELAFVQFSNKEEAERALKSPDAVMGNRFIKLLWANRDNIVEDKTQHYVTNANVNVKVRKENIQRSKAPAMNGSKVVNEAPVKKKENLELLKEELRKKQEMLERKRNEFRLQLDKLQKHGSGSKDEVAEEERAAKKLKVDKQLNVAAATKLSSPMPPAAAHPLNYVGVPFPINRYKLDNRPTSFRVNPPLPPEFANVNSLREHFAVFGDISNIELENSEAEDENCSINLSACIRFKTRQAAEKAFINGKAWKSHSLNLTWLKPNNSNPKQHSRKPSSSSSSSPPQDSSGEKGSSLSAPKDTTGTEIQSVEKKSADGSSKEEESLKNGEMELDEPNQDPASGGKQHAQEDVC